MSPYHLWGDVCLLTFAMNSLLAAICLVSGLISPGYAIICTQCSSSSLPSCSDSTVSCGSKLVCISIYEANVAGSQETYSFVRGCGEKKNCELSGSFHVPNGAYRFSSTCCNSDYCTPYTPALPPKDFSNSSKSCTYCLSNTATDCKSSEKIFCSQSENKCATFSKELKVGSITSKSVARGCGSRGFCDLGTQKTESPGVKIKVVAKCGASAALYSAITLLTLAAVSLIAKVS